MIAVWMRCDCSCRSHLISEVRFAATHKKDREKSEWSLDGAPKNIFKIPAMPPMDDACANCRWATSSILSAGAARVCGGISRSDNSSVWECCWGSKTASLKSKSCWTCTLAQSSCWAKCFTKATLMGTCGSWWCLSQDLILAWLCCSSVGVTGTKFGFGARWKGPRCVDQKLHPVETQKRQDNHTEGVAKHQKHPNNLVVDSTNGDETVNWLSSLQGTWTEHHVCSEDTTLLKARFHKKWNKLRETEHFWKTRSEECAFTPCSVAMPPPAQYHIYFVARNLTGTRGAAASTSSPVSQSSAVVAPPNEPAILASPVVPDHRSAPARALSLATFRDRGPQPRKLRPYFPEFRSHHTGKCFHPWIRTFPDSFASQLLDGGVDMMMWLTWWCEC